MHWIFKNENRNLPAAAYLTLDLMQAARRRTRARCTGYLRTRTGICRPPPT